MIEFTNKEAAKRFKELSNLYKKQIELSTKISEINIEIDDIDRRIFLLVMGQNKKQISKVEFD